MTPEQKQLQFHIELKALLVKFDAELTIENFGTNWGNWGDDDKIVVDFKWDEAMCEAHDTGVIPQLVLGTWVDGHN